MYHTQLNAGDYSALTPEYWGVILAGAPVDLADDTACFQALLSMRALTKEIAGIFDCIKICAAIIRAEYSHFAQRG